MRERLILVVGERAHVCLNKYPFSASHLLVAPNAHVSDLADLSVEDYQELMELTRKSAERLRRATRCEGMNIGFNLGKAGGAGIEEHLHAHIVPRWAGDHNFMPVVASTRVMPDYLDESWRSLLPHFADLEGRKALAP